MTVADCLIVKNEGRVIGRRLQSLCGPVQAVVIVDAGSTDDALIIAAPGFPVPLHSVPAALVRLGPYLP